MTIPQPPAPWNYPYPPNLTDFQPKARIIQAFFPDLPTKTVGFVTTVPHQYLNGLVVTFFRIKQSPNFDLFKHSYPITVLAPTVFSIPYDRPLFAFDDPNVNQSMQVLPAAEVGQSLASATNNNA